MEKLAIYGGRRALQRDIKYEWPLIDKGSEQAVLKQLHAGLSIYDKSGVVGEFEDLFSNMHGKRFGLITSSGTAALHSAYYAIGLKPNDEVVCPNYTFFASATPLFQFGALPVLADCDMHGSLKPSEIKRLLTSKTKAVVVTHMWGHPCDMDEIAKLCRNNGLYLIEDCSHAHGARYRGKLVGTFGDIGIWSLQTQKLIAAGEGGILVTDDVEIYDRAQLLGHFNKRCINEISKDSSYYKYSVTGTGLKYRAHPLGIAFALTQLKHLDEWIKGKQYNAKRIEEIIKGREGIKPLFMSDDICQNSYYAFPILIEKEKMGFKRDRLFQAIVAEGFLDIDIPKSTAPLHTFTLFKEPISPIIEYKASCIKGRYPSSEKIYSSIVKISVPVERGKGSRGEDFIECFRRVWNKVINNL